MFNRRWIEGEFNSHIIEFENQELMIYMMSLYERSPNASALYITVTSGAVEGTGSSGSRQYIVFPSREHDKVIVDNTVNKRRTNLFKTAFIFYL